MQNAFEETALPRDGLLRERIGYAQQSEAFIPSTVPQNHAANLMALRDGSLGCVWFGGTQEGMADISIYFARLEAGVQQWSIAVKLSDDATRSEQNPILFNHPDGALWLLYTAQKSGNQDTALVKRRVSQDCGKTWSAAEVMIDAAGTFVRQPIVVLDNGDFLLGTFLCRTSVGQKWVGDDDVSALRISSDRGKSWRQVEVPQSLGAVHMNVIDLKHGKLIALYRSRWADFIYQSRSEDGGARWSAPQPTSLPNNNSSIQAIRLQDGRLAVVYNHSSAAVAQERRLSLYDEIEDDEDDAPVAASSPPKREKTAFWGAPRAPLSLAFSSDEGKSWDHAMDLELGDGYCMTNNSSDKRNRELSYPSLYQTEDGILHVAFTYHRQVIKYLRIKL